MEVCDDVRLELLSRRKAFVESNTANDAWDLYLQNSEFQLSIVGLMNQTYSGIFFAYEHFVLSCYRIVSRDQSTRTNRGDFSQKLASAIGEAVAEQCWNGHEMRGRKLIRNAIAHNGGKFHTQLDPWKSDLHVIDGVIQIAASENRQLYGSLASNVDALVSAVLKRTATEDQ
jgi:hypothetical protein